MKNAFRKKPRQLSACYPLTSPAAPASASTPAKKPGRSPFLRGHIKRLRKCEIGIAIIAPRDASWAESKLSRALTEGVLCCANPIYFGSLCGFIFACQRSRFSTRGTKVSTIRRIQNSRVCHLWCLACLGVLPGTTLIRNCWPMNTRTPLSWSAFSLVATR